LSLKKKKKKLLELITYNKTYYEMILLFEMNYHELTLFNMIRVT